MKKMILVRKFGDIMIAITFAEAKEYDAVKEMLNVKEDATLTSSEEKATQTERREKHGT